MDKPSSPQFVNEQFTFTICPTGERRLNFNVIRPDGMGCSGVRESLAQIFAQFEEEMYSYVITVRNRQADAARRSERRLRTEVDWTHEQDRSPTRSH